ncbi:MAG: Holliday junction resolvase RuvX [Bacteroidales bacterium]|nr:Holliday junction resolvase RuvX [Bacteroidales bacterium]MCL2133371.1 Holliday junction resolvase RuvX [Bacteroidales bacterium]
MPRILSIDYGLKRTGLAVTDPLQIIATALDTVPTAELLDYLKKYTGKEAVDRFVVGYPRNMDNTPSEAAQHIDVFLKQLQQSFPNILISIEDERFTSKIAFQTMIDVGIKKMNRRNKATVDKISATIILQSFLSRTTHNS